MSTLTMVAVRCSEGCRDRDGKPFVIAQVDARAEAADVWCGKHRGIVRWRRRVAATV